MLIGYIRVSKSERSPGVQNSAGRRTVHLPVCDIQKLQHRVFDRSSPLLDRQSSKTPAPPAGVFSSLDAYPSATARRAPTVKDASGVDAGGQQSVTLRRQRLGELLHRCWRHRPSCRDPLDHLNSRAPPPFDPP
jgi:hypothetical protein